MSGAEGQKVVVIQDASRNISSAAIKSALECLHLKPGDRLTLLGVLHQVNTPSTFPFMGAMNLLGYKSKVGSSSLVGANKNIIKEAVARKTEEYHNSIELTEIRKLYEMNKVEFNVKLVAASSAKMVAVDMAKRLGATWIILDRQMKKDKKYFLEKLSCGISRIRRDNSVEGFRQPIDTRHQITSQDSSVKYDEMIPGLPEDEMKQMVIKDEMKQGIPEDEDLFSLELSPIIRRRTPDRNSLVKEPITDNEKEPPWTSVSTTSCSIYVSSGHPSSPSPYMGDKEATPSSSFSEPKYSPLEEERYTNIRRTTDGTPITTLDSQRLAQAEVNEIHYQYPRQTKGSIYVQQVDSVCSSCKNRRPNIESTIDFTYEELEAATNKFSDENYLSEGGFGFVYKGKLKNGPVIAVKQHKPASSQGEKEFKSEVKVLSKAQHKNVVMLLGSCSEGKHRLLVYEFICNGSLDEHLSKNSPKTLSWKDRMKIALGAARGLKYLHDKNIIHRDMRPNNILVTHDYEPLLGDFGLARTQHEESDHSSETRFVGTFGYLAPEYAESGKVSTKTDVYSFGVVLLELITGRRTIDERCGGKSLMGWAWPLLKERKYPDLIDPRVVDSHEHQLFWMVRVAEKCLSKDPERRLTMEEVVEALQRIQDEETVIGVEDFSPPHSDSESSKPELNILQEDNEALAKGKKLTPETSPISSRSQTSEIFSSASSVKTPSTRSSITSRSSGSSITRDKKGRQDKKKPRSLRQLPYGEMLS